MTRPDRFAEVNDVMLAESLRQLLPVVVHGVKAACTTDVISDYKAAEKVLRAWVMQGHGREERLGGRLSANPHRCIGEITPIQVLDEIRPLVLPRESPDCDHYSDGMWLSHYPRVTSVLLAEGVRIALPIAELGIRAAKTIDTLMPFRRGETVLSMWTRQKPGRLKLLGGPLPRIPRFDDHRYFINTGWDDSIQIIPEECDRPRRRPKRKPPAPAL